tara:strand:+ start:12799 stop:13239 length:441 start_codon:yes stop_codon:yes gene_type:complete
MVKIDKLKKILEHYNDKLVPTNPHNDSVYPVAFKDINQDYRPNIHRDKEFRKVYESIIKEGYQPLKYNYITAMKRGKYILDGKKRIAAMKLTGVSPTEHIPIKLLKVIGNKEKDLGLTTMTRGVIMIFLTLTILTFLLYWGISLFL